MIVGEKKIRNCKIFSIRYKIVKSNLQVLRWLTYTLVKREFDIYNINNSVSTLLTKPCTFELRMLYYNTLLLYRIDKIKMAGTSRKILSVMTSVANNYNSGLDSSVRIKTRIRTEVT